MGQSSQVILGRKQFHAQGIRYQIKALPLKFIMSGEFANDNFIVPQDPNTPGKCQIYNLDDKHRRDKLNSWMSRLLFKDGTPMSLADAANDGWDIEDLGRFLQAVVQISG